ncbi:MAG: LLM class F420-dependent oxidoreductase [Pseudomonadota bacterium]
MRFGVSFPTTEIGNNPDDIRTFGREVEAMGYDYITCIDHVIQSKDAVADDWRAYYTLDNPFHETLVLFGFLAACTERVELASAILILPQRPTVLAAKQLAEIDVLSNGRLRVGVGIGWNALEFDAMHQNFRNRASRIEEQIQLMRALWTESVVTFDGKWDTVTDSGINPLPVQRPIPIWFGAFVPVAIERAGRLGDGLLLNPRVDPGAQAQKEIDIFRNAAKGVGRDPDALGLDVTMFTEGRGENVLREEVEAWRAHGATHLTVRTMTSGLTTVGAHLKALETARKVLD